MGGEENELALPLGRNFSFFLFIYLEDRIIG